MQTKIRLEVLGMVVLIVILAISATYHRERVGQYHNDANEIIYRQKISNESNQIIENKQKQENVASLVSSLKQQYLDRSEVKKLSKICLEQVLIFSMSPEFYMYNHKNIAGRLGNNEQSKNTGNREEKK